MTAHVWKPVDGIVGPCGDIPFNHSDGGLIVAIRFSRVRGLPDRDRRLRFSNPLAMRCLHDNIRVTA